MGVVPLPPPSWMNREELLEYKYYLERQASSLPFGSRPARDPFGRRLRFPSETFVILLAVLAPWILTVIVKVLIGDWTL
jgi:hypothetical protein